jgi:hypothetical protein
MRRDGRSTVRRAAATFGPLCPRNRREVTQVEVLRQRGVVMGFATCKFCGAEFHRSASAQSCSSQCREAYINRQRKLARRARRPTTVDYPSLLLVREGKVPAAAGHGAATALVDSPARARGNHEARRHRAAHSMIRLSLILGIAFLALWQPKANAAEVKPQDAVKPELAIANPVAALPLASLSATRDRPLFSPSRRPPPAPVVRLIEPAPVPPVPPAPPPSIALIGVITEAEGSFAVVNQAGTNKSIRARMGDQIDGWTVTQIADRQLVLSRDGRVANFSMFKGSGGPPAIGRADRPLLAEKTAAPLTPTPWRAMPQPAPRSSTNAGATR